MLDLKERLARVAVPVCPVPAVVSDHSDRPVVPELSDQLVLLARLVRPAPIQHLSHARRALLQLRAKLVSSAAQVFSPGLELSSAWSVKLALGAELVRQTALRALPGRFQRPCEPRASVFVFLVAPVSSTHIPGSRLALRVPEALLVVPAGVTRPAHVSHAQRAHISRPLDQALAFLALPDYFNRPQIQFHVMFVLLAPTREPVQPHAPTAMRAFSVEQVLRFVLHALPVSIMRYQARPFVSVARSELLILWPGPTLRLSVNPARWEVTQLDLGRRVAVFAHPVRNRALQEA